MTAYQIESNPFHVIGDHTNFDLSPDFYGWNQTNVRYTGTPDKEPEASNAVNVGCYNYWDATRSVIWTADRKWTIYGNQYTGRPRRR